MLIFFILLFVFLIPTFNAYGRHHNNAGAIFLTNIFFGWTIIGWLVALIWSSTNNKKEAAKSEHLFEKQRWGFRFGNVDHS